MKLYRKFIRPVHCYPGQNYEPKTEIVEKEEKWYPEEELENLENKYGYLNKGSYSDLLFEEKYELYLLKEQEPKIGHWNFESRYYDAWSNKCSECGKRITTAVGIYASFCWNCGAKMTGDEAE